MDKYYGQIGYAETINKGTGVWIEQIVERDYYGEIQQTNRRLSNDAKVNSDFTLNMTISILADPYALSNFANIRYAKVGGTAWKVTTVEVKYPRLSLVLGGVWNGEQGSTT